MAYGGGGIIGVGSGGSGFRRPFSTIECQSMPLTLANQRILHPTTGLLTIYAQRN